MKLSAYDVTVLAVILALMVLLSPLPVVFFVPVLLVVSLRGFKMSLVAGALFGGLSVGLSFLMPASPVAYAFMQAPWIPIVTRILVVLGARGFRVLIERLIKQDKLRNKMLGVSLTAGVGSILNTVLVVGAILLFANVVQGAGEGGVDLVMSAVLPGIVLIFAPIELVVNMLLVPPLVFAVQKVEGRFPKRRGAKPQENTKQPTHPQTENVNDTDN